MRNLKFLPIAIILLFTLKVSAQKETSNKPAVTKNPVVTEDSIKKDVEKVVCVNNKRMDSVRKLFIERGATEEDIKVEDNKKVKNLVITKKGKTDEIVVIGAHYDMTSQGCGAIDNWTGIVIIANLYQTMKKFDTKKTYKFVAFGKEELGLIGSNAFVKNIEKKDRKNYCAMVNIDSFGLSYPQVLANISSNKLTKLAKEVSKGLNVPFAKATINGASSDSASFKAKGIPAVTLNGLNNKWQKYLHTSRDQLKNVNYTSVYIGYNHALRMAAKIDAKGCQDFR